MSKFETLKEMKYELSQMRKSIERLENAEPTLENLELVRCIERLAKEKLVAIHHYARMYGMSA